MSESVGVGRFALAFIWLISLVTYEPTDPAWLFTTGASHAPVNLGGRIGAFLAEGSFQAFGYAAYLVPAVVSVVGWFYFWCARPDAPYRKAIGVVLMIGTISAFASATVGGTDVAGRHFDAGGAFGTWIVGMLAEYLNRTGTVGVLVALLMMGMILLTQGSWFRALDSAVGRKTTRNPRRSRP